MNSACGRLDPGSGIQLAVPLNCEEHGTILAWQGKYARCRSTVRCLCHGRSSRQAGRVPPLERASHARERRGAPAHSRRPSNSNAIAPPRGSRVGQSSSLLPNCSSSTTFEREPQGLGYVMVMPFVASVQTTSAPKASEMNRMGTIVVPLTIVGTPCRTTFLPFTDA